MNHVEEKTKQSAMTQTRTDRSVYLHASRSLSILTVPGRLKREQRTGLPQLSPLLCLAWENAEAVKRETGG